MFESGGRFLVSHCCDLALLFGGILEALDDYNRHRIHSVIGYATPDEFAKRWEKINPQEVANR